MDVLRLLEVGGEDPHELGPGLERLGLAWNGEDGDPGLRVVLAGTQLERPEHEQQREWIDSGRSVPNPRDDGGATGRDPARDERDVRRPYVVHPRAERVPARERAAAEEVSTRVDGHEVAPGWEEHAARRADVEEEVRHQPVRVHGNP